MACTLLADPDVPPGGVEVHMPEHFRHCGEISELPVEAGAQRLTQGVKTSKIAGARVVLKEEPYVSGRPASGAVRKHAVVTVPLRSRQDTVSTQSRTQPWAGGNQPASAAFQPSSQEGQEGAPSSDQRGIEGG